MKKSIQTHIFFKLGGAILVLSILLSGILIVYQRNGLIDDIDRNLYNLVQIQKELLPADFHDRIFNENSLSEEKYNAIVDRNNRLCKDLNLQYLWSVIVIDDKIRFTTTTSPDKEVKNNKHASFFEIHSNPEVFDEVFEKMQPVISEFDNKWGKGRMMLSPYTDIHGRKYCFGVSMSIENVKTIVMQSVIISVVTISLIVLLFIPIMYFLSKSISEPIKSITKVAVSIANYKKPNPIPEKQKKCNEILLLDDSIFIMYESIQTKINELQTVNTKLEKNEEILRNQNIILDEKVAERTNELKLAKEKAELNQARLMEAQTVAKVGNWEVNLITKQVIWSDETYKIFELKKEDYENSHPVFLNYVHKDDIKRIEDVFAKSFSSKDYHSTQYRIITPAGKLKHIEEKWYVKHDENNTPIKAFGTCRDFTKEKIIENELKAISEEYKLLNKELLKTNKELQNSKEEIENNANILKEAQEIAHIGNWELDFNTNKLVWSDEIYRIFGCIPQKFGATYDAFLNFIHPDDRDFVETKYSEHLASKIPYDIVHRIQLTNGEIKYVNEKCNTYFDNNGKPTRSLGTVADITERISIENKYKKAKEKAEENELKLKLIADNFVNGMLYQVALIDETTRKFNYVSDVVRKLYGCTPDEAMNNPDLIYGKLHPEDIGELIEKEKTALKNMSVFKAEARVFNPDGSIRWAYYISKPRIINGVACWDGIEIDITERKQMEIDILNAKDKAVKSEYDLQIINDEYESLNEKLRHINEELLIAKDKAEESDRLKTEFINNMSHEIRTPMNGIIGFSRLLEKENLSTEKKKHYIDIIKNSGNRLLQVIDDILEISILGTKQVKLSEKEVCLNDLLLSHFSFFDIKAKENKTPLYLKKGLSDIESIILTDETKLNKILSNLLENALKYTSEGYIEFGYNLKTDTKPDVLEIYVKDTGIGISADKQEVVFKRFSQGGKDLSQKVSGLGLGLSIAKENTELLGGYIGLQSEEGKGATFFITIPYKPVMSFSEKSILNDNIKYNKKNKYTILIAEDEDVNYFYLETLLEEVVGMNINIIHAKTGKEAVEICKENQDIDIVFMDIKMPIMNGYEATKQIRVFNPNLLIIAQTAYTTKDDKAKIISAGCNDFISKPIFEENLNEIITKYLNIG